MPGPISGGSGAAAAGTLTGSTLAAGVTASSLTSVGTLVGGASGAGFTLNFAASTLSGVIPIANLATGTPTGSKFIRDDGTLQTIAGGGDALTTNPLSQFAATTSAQLRSTLSDENGTGVAIFDGSTSQVLVTPLLGTPTSGVLTNCTGLPTTGLVDAAVTLAKMANLAQDQFIGRTTGSTGVPETATITAAARTVLDDTTAGAMVNTLGGATSTGTGGLARAADPKFTGAVGGMKRVMNFGASGSGSALATQTIEGTCVCEVAGTITGWSISVPSGTATVKFWKIAAGTAIPTIANVINTSGVAISSGTHVRSTTVSDFTTTDVAAGDIIICVITAVATATWISVRLEITTT